MSHSFFSLHPLVLLNLADQHVRSHLKGTSIPRVGVLLGSNTDGSVEITNSFDLVLNELALDRQYLQERLTQQRTILPEEEIVGLYEINNDLSIEFIKSLNGEFEGILVNLSFSPQLASKKYSNEKFYQLYDAKTGEELKSEIATKDAEKIAVDTVLEIKETNYNDLNKIEDQISSQKFILSNLKEKILLVKELLENESDHQQIQNYYNILRDINSFIHKISYKQSSETKKTLVELENQSNLLLNLGQINDNLSQLSKIGSDIKKAEGLRELL